MKMTAKMLIVGAAIALSVHANHATAADLSVEINKKELKINSVIIPLNPVRKDLDAALGKQPRVDKRKQGTLYVFDELGISYRTDPEKDQVTGITFYCRPKGKDDLPWPQNKFSGSVVFMGTKIPLDQTVDTVTSAFRKVKKVNVIQGFFYSFKWGKGELNWMADTTTGEMDTLNLVFNRK
jgi:hypothetical protein